MKALFKPFYQTKYALPTFYDKSKIFDAIAQNFLDSEILRFMEIDFDIKVLPFKTKLNSNMILMRQSLMSQRQLYGSIFMHHALITLSLNIIGEIKGKMKQRFDL